MEAKLLTEYRKMRTDMPFGIVGQNAAVALSSARTLLKFRELEDQDLVRIKAEHENENYFSVYGEPDTEAERNSICEAIESKGMYCVFTEVNDGCSCCGRDDWELADSIGMCIYDDPTDPYENSYVIDLMARAIEEHGKLTSDATS